MSGSVSSQSDSLLNPSPSASGNSSPSQFSSMALSGISSAPGWMAASSSSQSRMAGAPLVA